MVIQMKKIIYIVILAILTVSMFGACDDPIFIIMAKEYPPTNPFVEGSPSNFVVLNNAMYVASGKFLYKFSGGRNWSEVTSFDNNFFFSSLAATDNYLYVICFKDSDEINNRERRIMRLNPADNSWTQITYSGDYSQFQTIYAANNILFIGAHRANNNQHAVLYLTSGTEISNTFIEGPHNFNDSSVGAAGLLRGAVFNGTNTYICTPGGIYLYPSTTPISGSTGRNFVSIIWLEDTLNTVVAMSRDRTGNNVDGNLFNITPGPVALITNMRSAPSDPIPTVNYTGALAIWRDSDGTPALLLASRQDTVYSSSTYIYGYMELTLNPTGGIQSGATFVSPGSADVSSVDDKHNYDTSLGINPVNHIFQVPSSIDPNRILFASTQQNGVWSYRERSGERRWNAEEDPEDL
jgi:hypothetical protein